MPGKWSGTSQRWIKEDYGIYTRRVLALLDGLFIAANVHIAFL
jgi:hypothetical protein